MHFSIQTFPFWGIGTGYDEKKQPPKHELEETSERYFDPVCLVILVFRL